MRKQKRSRDLTRKEHQQYVGAQRSFQRAIEDEPHTLADRIKDVIAGDRGEEMAVAAHRILRDAGRDKGPRLVVLVGGLWGLDKPTASAVYSATPIRSRQRALEIFQPIALAAWREIQAGGVPHRAPEHVRGSIKSTDWSEGIARGSSASLNPKVGRSTSPPRGMTGVDAKYGVFVKKV